ncbi:MAG: hypothetical protein J6W75_08040 [Bacteroidaceae bacterium]|nr:hypothetical protein [Bacteroidaceae bacterium]
MRAISIAKLDEGLVNEDAAKATEKWIAVSDGAGGGGVFADLWSKYLVEHLPDEPIADYQVFDAWIDGIWESFYNDCEKRAKTEGGLLLNKFYDEGSFATLVAVWKDGQWMSYGDSVAFCYCRKSGKLQHSFGRISEFNNPPYLVNCKDPTHEKGFRSGSFEVGEDSVVFAASDALSHYIIMMYEVAHEDAFAAELDEEVRAQSKDSNFVKAAVAMKQFDFEKDILGKLLSSSKNAGNFKRHIASLRKRGLIAHDDYSLAVM